jgi:hypothetical protein
MRTIANWFRHAPRPQTRAHLVRPYKPRLEELEDRQLLSVSASGLGTFILYNNSELFLHDMQGFHRIDINATSVSAGFTLDNQLQLALAAFIVYNNGQLFEWSAAHGFQFIDSNVVSVSARNVHTPDAVFILYNNSQLFEHVGRSPVTGYSLIAGNVISMSPTFGNGDVFYVQTNSILSEHLKAGGSMVIDGNVKSVSAGLVEADSVFILYTNTALYLFNPSGTQHFTPVDTNVASMDSATSTIPGTATDLDAVFYITPAGTLVEWLAPNATNPSPDGSFIFVADTVASISEVPGSLDDVFIVYNNEFLFEHRGLSRRSGFTFIDVNVSP